MFSPTPASASVLGKMEKLRQQNGGHWSEEEHLQFLIGLKELGKGAWRDISRKYVPTRTPTQVASHSQKYFTKLAGAHKRKRSPEKTPIMLRVILPTSEETSGESHDSTVLPQPETAGTESNTSGSKSKRTCPEVSAEAQNLPAPLSPTAPVPVISPSDVFWQQTLKEMMKEQARSYRQIPSYPVGPLPTLANYGPASCVGTFHEHYASAAVSAQGFPRVSSFCSSDSVADSWGSSGAVLPEIKRPEVKRVSENLLASLHKQLPSPAASKGSMSDDDSMQTIAAADILCTLRRSSSSAFHEIYPGSPLSVS
eukprot:gene8254-1523_t